ncbi:uncharacterized protein LOC114145655 [Xiphophorus couchianus]|uniref:uncharacterized protein LOC114145655 n=1 Tax=Xiphophorus couchianus TaxID=32473 RepID=UPI0010160E82|nr:uncharacterized protein LOC114145655 [Xiphophorus couchianus]XP_027875116.1 uncharacterized protein LOC114145655 [Xiphophorus couchianus]
MGCLFLMVLSLTVLLLDANNFPPVNMGRLQYAVSQILNRYRPSYEVEGQRKTPMFSLVARIPFNSETNQYDISQVTDDANNVKDTIVGCEVYTGTNILAATVLRWPDVVAQCPDGRVQWPIRSQATTWADAYCQNARSFNEGRAEHAEYRILQNLHTWLNNQNMGQDLLLFYAFASPCTRTCTNRDSDYNILSPLTGYVEFNIVFVFSKVHQPRNVIMSPDVLQDALKNLGGTIGLDRIFRCDRVNGRIKCVNCNDNENVAGWCYDDNQPPA